MPKEFAMLSHHWNGSFDKIRNWKCSRKYNGWSAIWDGGITTGMLASSVPWYYRGGDKREYVSTGLWSLGRNNKPKVINAPRYFTDKLPKGIPVHGELWYRDRLDIIKRTCGLKRGYSAMWQNILFKAFGIKPYKMWECVDKLSADIPQGRVVYEGVVSSEAMGYLTNYQNNTFDLVDNATVKSEKCIEVFKDMADRFKWEGLMFSNPNGLYECKRSWNNLKYKNVYESEAAICGYEKGKTGRVVGKVGALQATLIWNSKVSSVYGGNDSMVGKEANFCISGLMDEEREWDTCRKLYPEGSKIRFKYSGISTHGIPQSCNIYREV